MHERRFHADSGLLRSSSRVDLMEVDHVVELCLGIFAAESVLDVGTGTGLFAEAFAARGLAVTGIDANPEMLERAQGYVPQGHFRQAPAEAVPYPDNMFDLVFLGHVLHETDDRLKALNEAHRVARLGVAVLEWPYQEEDHGPPLSHRIKPEEIARLAELAEFQQIETLPLTHMILYRLSM
jgi:ubiquinone/menaquinone biosynthesis C-methylase UbiE